MKQTSNKKIIVAVFLVIFAVFITGCHSKNSPENHTLAAKNGYPEEIIGTWETTWKYEGNEFYDILVINDDGYYKSTSYKNGIIIDEAYDLWYMENNIRLICAIDGNLGHCVARYFKNGNLYMGDSSVGDGRLYTKKQD